MHLKIKRAEDGQYYFILVARNGQTLMTSETYTRKANAMKSAVKIADQMGTHIE